MDCAAGDMKPPAALAYQLYRNVAVTVRAAPK